MHRLFTIVLTAAAIAVSGCGRVEDEKVVAEKAVTDKAVTEKAMAEKVAPEKVVAEKAVAEKVVVEKATPEKAVVEKVVGDGSRPMFNGKDLTGWKTTGNWIVEDDNTVALKPRPGERGWTRYDAYLTTDRTYKDFVLDLDFKFNKGGNSGVFLRVRDPKSQVSSGFEVQILDTHGKKKFGAHDCGGVIGTAGPSKMMVKPAGEWNHYTITCIGSQLNVVLNGEPIIDLDLSKSGLKNRPLEGYIGFQDEAKFIWYRNVRIKEVTDGGAAPAK